MAVSFSESVPAGLSEGQQLTVYRIVQEALTNTLKHAGPAATAKVILDYADGAVDVQVTDTGLGVPANKLTTIFEPFHQQPRLAAPSRPTRPRANR